MHLCVFLPQDLLERAEWGADLPTVENNLQEHNAIHTAVEELMSSLQEARSYEVHNSSRANRHTRTHTLLTIGTHSLCFRTYNRLVPQAKVSPNFKSSYCETLAKLEHQYCKLLVSTSLCFAAAHSLQAISPLIQLDRSSAHTLKRTELCVCSLPKLSLFLCPFLHILYHVCACQAACHNFF